MNCKWPEETCACYMAQAEKPEDMYGRVWMHCESGLSMTKASAGRLMFFCLKNRVLIGEADACRPEYHGCAVSVSVRLRPDQFEMFEVATGGKLKKPAVLKLS